MIKAVLENIQLDQSRVHWLHPKETPSASFSQAAKPLNHMYLQNPSNPFVPTRPSNLCVGQDLQTHVYLQALRELYIAFRGVTTHISLEEHTSLLQVPQTTMRRKWPQMSLDISSSISPKDPSAYWSSIWHCSSAGVYDQLAVWQV